MTLGIGQFLLIVVQPLWARMLIALVFVAPAAIAGYHATHGIVKHTMPSENWQVVFSVIGAIAVGATAFIRVAAMSASVPPGQRLLGPDTAVTLGSIRRGSANSRMVVSGTAKGR